MTDVILYAVISEPGGVDGLDSSDKGGTLVNASFDRDAMHKKYGRDCRYRIAAEVVVMEIAKRAAMAKLNPIDRLVLFGPKGKP